MTISLCKHSFPIQPPHGSLAHPGPCVGCGATWNEVQAELQRQKEALIHGTSHDGSCPSCTRNQRLFRYQPADQPWHEIGHEQPVTFLCIGCWNATADAENAFNTALLDAI